MFNAACRRLYVVPDSAVIVGVGNAAPNAIVRFPIVWKVSNTARFDPVLEFVLRRIWWKSVARCEAAGIPNAERVGEEPPCAKYRKALLHAAPVRYDIEKAYW